MESPGHEGEQARGCGGIGENSSGQKTTRCLLRTGERGCWGSDSYCFCFLLRGLRRGGVRPADCESGLESSLRGQEGGKIGNGLLEESKDKQDQRTKRRDLVRGKLRENPSDSGNQSRGILRRHHLLQPYPGPEKQRDWFKATQPTAFLTPWLVLQ